MLKKKLDQFISHAQAQKTSRAPDMVDYIAKVIREKVREEKGGTWGVVGF